jgi:hypothetical protein
VTGSRGGTGPTGPGITGPRGVIGATGPPVDLAINPIAIGIGAGLSLTLDTISIGQEAGKTNQKRQAIAIGSGAGLNSQKDYAVAIGYQAGTSTQTDYAVAIGYQSGYSNQQNSAVAIGNSAGKNDQQYAAVAIGVAAGEADQGSGAVAIGEDAGKTDQLNFAVAIGKQAGQTNQQALAIAIGNSAGNTRQCNNSIAIGYNAGNVLQGGLVDPDSVPAIAIGSNAAASNQGSGGIAIGSGAGGSDQKFQAIAIGSGAGGTRQGNNCIAIGQNAGYTDQPPNSIVLNANTSILNGQTGNAFYVAPIRANNAITLALGYDSTNKEIVTSTALSPYVFSVPTWYYTTVGGGAVNITLINGQNIITWRDAYTNTTNSAINKTTWVSGFTNDSWIKITFNLSIIVASSDVYASFQVSSGPDTIPSIVVMPNYNISTVGVASVLSGQFVCKAPSATILQFVLTNTGTTINTCNGTMTIEIIGSY